MSKKFNSCAITAVDPYKQQRKVTTTNVFRGDAVIVAVTYFRFNVTGEFHSMRDVGGWNGSNAYPHKFASQRHGHQDSVLTRQQADEDFSRGEPEVLEI